MEIMMAMSTASKNKTGAIKTAFVTEPEFIVKPDRPSHIYFCDETAVFNISGGGKVTIQFTLETVTLLEEKRVMLDPDSPLTLKYSLKTPGFLRCRVFTEADEVNPVAEAGVAFDPYSLRATVPVADDFDAFWRKAAAKQESLSENLSFRRLDCSTDSADIYEVSMACLNNGRCYGYLGIPKRKEKVPLYVNVSWHGSPASCKEVSDSAILIMRWQNFPAPDTAEEELILRKKFLEDHKAKHFYLAGKKNPEKMYLLGVILGCGRLLNYVMGRPEIDASHVVYKGFSMEGDFGIFLAGLNPGITAVVCGGTSIGEPSGHLHGKLPTLLYRTYPSTDPDKFNYFDGIAFARNISCPVLMYSAFLDNATFATQQFPIYNALCGEKTMVCLPSRGHMGTPPECMKMEAGWIQHQLGL